MKIVDCYGVNDGSTFVSVELAEDRFVDVKVCDWNGKGLVYVMQNEDGSTVYSDKAYSDNGVDACYPGFEYDEKAVVEFVKDYIKEHEGKEVGFDGVLKEAFVRAGDSGSRETGKEIGFDKE